MFLSQFLQPYKNIIKYQTFLQETNTWAHLSLYSLCYTCKYAK